MAFIKYLTDIQFDYGAVSLLHAECLKANIKRPLVVTDKGVRAAGVADMALASISGKLPLEIFDETPGNPTEAAVESALAAYRAHDADGIVAIGGGSALDLAKALAIAATHPGPLPQYCTIDGGSNKITDACAPTIAIPTTSGTGSEVARGAIIILHDGRKVGFHSWHLMPRCAICDPDLTLALPPALTAATGMDAIAHCIESFLSPAFNPPAEGIALDGLERAMKWIDVAVNDGKNREARKHMMSASMQGAMAFQKGLGAVHSLSHALGSYAGKSLHHGTLNAVLLPAVLRFNASAESVIADDKYRRLKRAAGLAQDRELDELIVEVNRRIGIPFGLGAMGVPESFVDEAVQKAMHDHCHGTNPRVATPEQYAELIRESW
ncbi:MAG TPA: iron-containing alcohol dehydrogenase [Burkholderiaceae bacterium]|nr:iron-containing alcohol dehydrogenase [Burkholderiaceae bacterium]